MRRVLISILIGLSTAACGGPGPADGDGGSDAAPNDVGPRIDAACTDRDGDGACASNDCDDDDANRFPGHPEVCDAAGVDEDCDPTTFGLRDIDGDGYPDARCCNGATCGTDCDEARPGSHPGSPEICNRLDDDCDGVADETVTEAGFADDDHDGHGDPAVPRTGCRGSVRISFVADDCDDTSRLRHGALADFCDGIDNDCDGIVDEAPVAVPWYLDLDEDSWGAGASVLSCTPVSGRSIDARDCDDARATRNPGASEICNGVDDDCNGVADYEIGLNDWEDDDGDGHADLGCAGGDDCDDRNRGAYPGATEVCNRYDDDCDTRVDESCVPPFDAGMPDAGVPPIDAATTPDTGPSCVPTTEYCDGTDQDCDTLVDEGGVCPTCSAGYELAGDFVTCVDIDECSTATAACDPMRACTNTDGSYDCGPCGSGYVESGLRDCMDVDECLVGNGGCDPVAPCMNFPGGHSCGSCPSGYVGTGDTSCRWDDASLVSLTSTVGSYTFAAATLTYAATAGTYEGRTVLTPTAPAGFRGTITVAGVAVTSGTASAPVPLPPGSTPVAVVVTAESGRSATYTVTYARALTASYVKPTSLSANDSFGTVVDIDGDTMVVGNLFEDGSGTGINPPVTETATSAGAVNVFVRSGSTWTQQAYIKAPNAEAGDYFGTSVAIQGDTLIVGATHESSNSRVINGDMVNNLASTQGAAYVYRRTGTTWALEAYLKASDGQAGCQFGSAVAIENDVAVVGSTYCAVGTGVAHVFRRTGTSWSLASRLAQPDPQRSDFFGASVAISGGTIVVGSAGESSTPGSFPEDTALPNSGAAYVFTPSGSLWGYAATLRAPNAGASDGFGFDVDISGNTIVVGAYGEDSGATGIGGNMLDESASGSGAVYVFTGSGTSWTLQAYLKSINTSANQQFGGSVGIDGDLLVVTARGDASDARVVDGDPFNTRSASSGSAHVFRRTGSTWSYGSYLKAFNADAADEFGRSAAISGSFVVVGSWAEDSASSNPLDNTLSAAGAVYVFQ